MFGSSAGVDDDLPCKAGAGMRGHSGAGSGVPPLLLGNSSSSSWSMGLPICGGCTFLAATLPQGVCTDMLQGALLAQGRLCLAHSAPICKQQVFSVGEQREVRHGTHVLS